MTTALVHWTQTARLYVNEYSDPKRKGLPARAGSIDIGRRIANEALDAAAADYGARTGYAVVPCFPHTLPAALTPKPPKKARKPRKAPKLSKAAREQAADIIASRKARATHLAHSIEKRESFSR